MPNHLISWLSMGAIGFFCNLFDVFMIYNRWPDSFLLMSLFKWCWNCHTNCESVTYHQDADYRINWNLYKTVSPLTKKQKIISPFHWPERISLYIQIKISAFAWTLLSPIFPNVVNRCYPGFTCVWELSLNEDVSPVNFRFLLLIQ